MHHLLRATFATAILIAGTLAAPAQNQPLTLPSAPYKAVAIVPPKPMDDPAFDALRKQLGDIAQRKDRAALSPLVANQGFFWERENGNRADKRKSGADNLATALGLNNKDGAGWEILFSYADDPTASPSPDHKGAVCAPAEPVFNGAEFDALLAARYGRRCWPRPDSPIPTRRFASPDRKSVV